LEHACNVPGVAQDKPELPSMRVVGDAPGERLDVIAEREAREQAIKQLLRENRMSPADQAALDDHLSQSRRRAMVRKLAAAVILGIALLYRALV
jgi:uncharacterized protein (DUF2236 family)